MGQASGEQVGPSLAARCLAEALGTFLLVFFGCGAVHTAVLTGAQSGLWQVAIVWGVAVALAVFLVGGMSGAHINPAITAALAAWGRFPLREVGPGRGRFLGGGRALSPLSPLPRPEGAGQGSDSRPGGQ